MMSFKAPETSLSMMALPTIESGNMAMPISIRRFGSARKNLDMNSCQEVVRVHNGRAEKSGWALAEV
jgi:hypothetical protein